MKLNRHKNNPKFIGRVKKNLELIPRLQKLPTAEKACLFILLVGVLGAVVGEIFTEVEINKCVIEKQCLIVDPTHKRLDGIGRGAYAGMGAAIFSSLPILLKELGDD